MKYDLYRTFRNSVYTGIAALMLANPSYARPSRKEAVSVAKAAAGNVSGAVTDLATKPGKIKELAQNVVGGTIEGVVGGLEAGEKVISGTELYKSGQEWLTKYGTAEGRKKIWVAKQAQLLADGQTETTRLEALYAEAMGESPVRRKVVVASTNPGKPAGISDAERKRRERMKQMAAVANAFK